MLLALNFTVYNSGKINSDEIIHVQIMPKENNVDENAIISFLHVQIQERGILKEANLEKKRHVQSEPPKEESKVYIDQL